MVLNSNMDHRNGMIKIYLGSFLSVSSNRPDVKIVVGQGSPDAGDSG
jgi:hypothetical protein